MDYIIKLAFALLVFLHAWLFQMENQEWDAVRSLLKDAGNFAVHDAALQLDDRQLSEGRIRIDEDQAYAVFTETLARNLGLNGTLEPMAGSRLHSRVRILKFDIVDGGAGIVFPYVYEDSEFGIVKLLQGPSVVAVIETEHPLLSARSHNVQPIRVPAIQEHKWLR